MRDLVLFASDGGVLFDHRIPQVNAAGMARDTRRRMFANYKQRALLVLEGGSDIHPDIYGQEVTHSWVNFHSAARDDREIEMLLDAIELNIPILGICRGHQLLSAVFGGDLVQDLYYDLGSLHANWHDLVPDNELTRFANGRRMSVNSLHHQAVCKLPKGSRSLGRHPEDGTFEAAYHPRYRAVGVQWHPEMIRDLELLGWVRETLQ